MKRSKTFPWFAREIAANQARQLSPNEFGGAATTQKFSASAPKLARDPRDPTETQNLGSRLGTELRLPQNWGRHGFDGNGCGHEACRGAPTLNRVQNKQLPTLNWLTQLN